MALFKRHNIKKILEGKENRTRRTHKHVWKIKFTPSENTGLKPKATFS